MGAARAHELNKFEKRRLFFNGSDSERSQARRALQKACTTDGSACVVVQGNRTSFVLKWLKQGRCKDDAFSTWVKQAVPNPTTRSIQPEGTEAKEDSAAASAAKAEDTGDTPAAASAAQAEDTPQRLLQLPTPRGSSR